MAKGKNPKVEINANFSADDVKKWCEGHDKKKGGSNEAMGAGYFIGFIGSMIYWMQAAVGFGAVVTGFLKSLAWPAYIVYKLLESFYGAVNL
jgi:hypothetical protein